MGNSDSAFKKEFGTWLYIQVRVLKLLRKFAPNGMKPKLYDREHEKKRAILHKRFSPILPDLLERAKNDSLAPVSSIPQIIWIFWWQGNQQDIPLVDMCIRSVEKQKPQEAKVIVLTKENLDQYCTIASHIKQKREEGIITLTHFSDMVRVAVLAEHGGVWFDATVYAASDFSYIFKQVIWSIKKPSPVHKYIPKGRWSIYAIGTVPHSLLFLLMQDLFSVYWSTYTSMLDYFLVDYCIDFLYEEVPEIRALIDSIPMNNPQVLGLQNYLGLPEDISLIAGLTADTQLFKLSWKKQVPLMVEGKKTVFSQLIDDCK